MRMAAGSLSEKLVAAEHDYKSGEYFNAFEKYFELADDGHAESQVMVGYMYQAGLGTRKDISLACEWFERAAALGSAVGSFYFARHLSSVGEHVRALKYYRKACEKEHLPSIFRVGHSFAFGKGASVDLIAAYKYLNCAARLGHVQAIRDLGVLDILGNRGLVYCPLGILEYLYAGVAALFIGTFDPDSDRLRG